MTDSTATTTTTPTGGGPGRGHGTGAGADMAKRQALRTRRDWPSTSSGKGCCPCAPTSRGPRSSPLKEFGS